MSRESLGGLVEYLQRIGFSQYEARVYITLARNGAMNGNEISLASEVPSSKTYETIRKLINKGALAAFAEHNGTEYVALPPSQVIERYRESMNHTLDHLEVELGHLTAFEVEEQVLSMRGDLSVLARSREVIDAAHGELYVSLWDKELHSLHHALLDAYARGVRLHVVLYGQATDLNVKYVYHHAHAQIVGDRIGGRLLVLVADGGQTVIARFAKGSQVYGVSSQNRALALVAREYLGHDIILESAKERIDRDDWDSWWKSREDLVEIIVGRELAARDDDATATGGTDQEAG